MIEAGIVDGDLLFVTPTRALRDAAKHIVVCRVAGITLVKQLELRAGELFLVTGNQTNASLYPMRTVRKRYLLTPAKVIQ